MGKLEQLSDAVNRRIDKVINCMAENHAAVMRELNTNNSGLSVDHKMLQQSIADMHTDIKRMREELQRLRKDIYMLDSKNEKLEKENQKLKRKIELLRCGLDNLQSQTNDKDEYSESDYKL